MHARVRSISLVATSLAVLAAPAIAHAGEQGAMIIDGTLMKSFGDESVGDAGGIGAELRMWPDHEAFTLALGGFAAIGRAGPGERARDIYDLHLDMGIKLGEGDAPIVPFVSAGLNVLAITTHDPIRTYRGTTLGVNGKIGVMGHIAAGWVYRVNAAYLGAIVPGTGEDLGSVVLQMGFGKLLDD